MLCLLTLLGARPWWLQVVGLVTLFRNMDTDNDGVVSLQDLCAALEQRGVHVTDENARVRRGGAVILVTW